MAKYTIELSDYELEQLKSAVYDGLNYCCDEVSEPKDESDYIVSFLALARELPLEEDARDWADHILHDAAKRSTFEKKEMEYFRKQADNNFDFELNLPMEDIMFYDFNGGYECLCRAENNRYIAVMQCVPTWDNDGYYIVFNGKRYDLDDITYDNFKEKLPKELIDYVRQRGSYDVCDGKRVEDFSLPDIDFYLYDTYNDKKVVPGYDDGLTAEIDFNDNEITEEDFSSFMRFAMEHPHAFEKVEDRLDITGWAKKEV